MPTRQRHSVVGVGIHARREVRPRAELLVGLDLAADVLAVLEDIGVSRDGLRRVLVVAAPRWHLHQTEWDIESMPYVDLVPCMSAAVKQRAGTFSVVSLGSPVVRLLTSMIVRSKDPG